MRETSIKPRSVWERDALAWGAREQREHHSGTRHVSVKRLAFAIAAHEVEVRSTMHVLAQQPAGVMLSHGLGDPASLPHAVEATRQLIDADVPCSASAWATSSSAAR
jgi:carbamoylphosphate synthase small subunit